MIENTKRAKANKRMESRGFALCRGGCDALPFCHLQIKVLRGPYPHRWKCTQTGPSEPKTLGEHLKRRRLQLRLMQAEVAERLGVHIESLKSWERGATEPMIRYVPKILEFLGYNPEPEPADLAQRLIHIRRQLGLTQEDLAKVVAVDPVILYRWEKGLAVPPQAKLNDIETLLRARNAIIPQ